MDKKISELDVNPSITGAEEVPTERNSSNYKNTYTSLKTWILNALDVGVETVTGVGVDNLDPKNPVIAINAGDIGLGNVDNTSDADKPVSTATQTALNLKQDILLEGAFVDGDKTKLDNQSGTNTGDETTATIKSKRPIKTVNSQSLEGTGNVVTPDTTYTDAEIKTKYENNADTNAFTDAEKTNLGNQSGTNTGDQKTVESFPTQETTAFTVADNSDRAWIDCNFAAETEVTITATSIGVIGEPVYFALSGDGQIKFVASGVTINFNAFQSLIVGSKGDKIALIKTASTTYEIV